MRIGELDERITIYSVTETNNLGEMTKSYTDEGDVWAKVISRKGQESFEAARMGSDETIKVLLRYRSDIKTDWRIGWRGNTYNIIHVDRSLRREGELWIMCETKDAE